MSLFVQMFMMKRSENFLNKVPHFFSSILKKFMKILGNFYSPIYLQISLLLTLIGLLNLSIIAQPAEVYFRINVPEFEETFVIKITDPIKIQTARDILSGKLKDYNVGGIIIKKPVCYNSPWSSYIDPDSVTFYQIAGEACQSTIQFVEDNLSNFNEALSNRWCPTSKIIEEIPAPNCSKYSITTVNSASYRRSGIAADSIVSAFGQNLTTATDSPKEMPLPISLAGTTVRVKDSQGVERMAQMLFASPAQVNYLIPKGTAVGMAEVTITNSNGISSYGQIQIVSSSPDIFAANADGKGVAAALVQRVKADGSMTYEPISRYDPVQKISVPVPIDLGADLGTKTDQVYLAIFGTGLGLQALVVDANAVFSNAKISKDSIAIYAGPQNFYAGLDQVNVLLPRTLAGQGELNLQMTIQVKNIGTNTTVSRYTNIVKINVK